MTKRRPWAYEDERVERDHGSRDRHVLVPLAAISEAVADPLFGDLIPWSAGSFHRQGRLHIRRPSGHPAQTLYLPLEGEAQIQISGRALTMKVGEIFWVSGRTGYSVRSHAAIPFSFLTLAATGEAVEEHRRMILPNPLDPRVPIDASGEEWAESFRGVLSILKARERLFHLRASVSLRSLLLELLRRVRPSLPASPLDGTLALFRQRIAEDLSLAEMAATTPWSVPLFRKRFTERFGAPPLAHFHRLKMERARESLRHGQSLREAAATVGIHNPAWFSRLYRKVTGRTPGADRFGSGRRNRAVD